MDHTIEILHTGFVTHDVKQFVVTKPDGFAYEPGQGVELALDLEGWREEGRPFTPTGDPRAPALEFTIKGYPEHDGMTTRLHDRSPGDRLRMSEPFGTITDRGPGVFIAGGAGVTPFLSILRGRAARGELDDCALVFSNHTPADVICEKELRALLGDRAHLTCTRESAPGYDDRRIGRALLNDVVDVFDGRRFYLCGPPDFVEEITDVLGGLGAARDRIVLEE